MKKTNDNLFALLYVVARLIEMMWLKMMSTDVVRVLCAHSCFSKLAATFRLLSARAFVFNALIVFARNNFNHTFLQFLIFGIHCHFD